MTKKLKLVLWIGIITSVVIPFSLVLIGRSVLHNSDIPQHKLLFESAEPKTILAFFPHPDDEVTVAGTLMKMVDQGHDVILLCLTRGEAADTGGEISSERLAEIRSLEMQHSAKTIGASHLELLNNPDSGLEKLGVDSLKKLASGIIDQFKPDVLVSYDSKVGLYGHPDHQLTGLILENLFLERVGESSFSPKKLFQITLSPKQINLALKISKGFQENYPKDQSKGLPKPDFSISTQPYFKRILQVIKGHESQAKTLKDLLPYHDKIPPFIYSRIFDREYFHEVKP
ncbi:PIG-L family deacetylase [Algoriphagus aestuarii]|nr:PIG-L family deacetylase [Algoriphagus aestuarii]